MSVKAEIGTQARSSARRWRDVCSRIEKQQQSSNAAPNCRKLTLQKEQISGKGSINHTRQRRSQGLESVWTAPYSANSASACTPSPQTTRRRGGGLFWLSRQACCPTLCAPGVKITVQQTTEERTVTDHLSSPTIIRDRTNLPVAGDDNPQNQAVDGENKRDWMEYQHRQQHQPKKTATEQNTRIQGANRGCRRLKK